MASNTHVDSRVAERRLRPIYDWLDSGNNKKALQEAEKVLKKQPNFLCAKVLKALALQRLGREAECEEILEKVCQEVPTDEATLQAITICYRAVHKPKKICEVYSAASKKDPTNEELLTHLFMSYVRIGDYKKQHQNAMSLYKLRQKNPYYFWAVMSVVMQAKGDEIIGKAVALKLAEKMVSKFVSEGKIEAEQEVHLYLMILEMQGKYEEALDVIEGELGEKLKSLVTTSVKRIELLMKLERWKEANVLIKCQLEKSPDSWIDYTNYLETTLKFYEEFQKFKDNDNGAKEHFDNRVPIRSDGGECIVWHEADYSPQMAQEYITQLIKKVESEKKKIRGPYLAQLELYKLLVNRSEDAQNIIGNITDLLVNYFDKFAEKPICVNDLKPYLSLLSSDSVSLFLKRINDIVGLDDNEPAKSTSSLQKHISKLQFTRTLGFHCFLSVEERLRLCDYLLNHYRSTQELVSDDKLPTEYLCNDPYIILLSHVLFSIYQDTNSSEHIIRAIYHLEEALSKSPSNFHFKILLVKFYLLLGGGEQAFHFYEHLELKHIQLDSMGYLLATSIYGLGNISHAVGLYDLSLKFFISNTNDSVDHLTYAYKYGSFVKIEEFIEFRDRLNESLHYYFFQAEKILHDILSATDHAQTELILKGVPRIENIDWSTVRDNRDLNVVASYEPSGKRLNEKTVAKSFENLKNYVKLRVLTIKCLGAVLSLVKDEQTGEKNNVNDECLQNGNALCPKDALTDLLDELKNLYDELNSQDLDLNVQEIINAPSPCRLRTYLTVPIHQIISDMTNVILQVEENNSKEDDNLTKAAQPVSQTLKTVTDACIKKINNSDLLKRRELLETIVSVVEMISITAMLCGFFKTLIKRTRKNQKKGKRRKEEEGGRDLTLCKNLLKDVSECIRDLDEALNRVIEQNSEDDLSSEVKALNIENESNNSNPYSSIVKKLRESYNFSLQEIKQFLQDKQTYVYAL